MKRISVIHRARVKQSEIISATADDVSIRYNWPRRLRNALIALASADSRWMIWIEREIDPTLPIEEMTRLIERRARALFVIHYPFSHSDRMRIVFGDTPFSDSGALLPG